MCDTDAAFRSASWLGNEVEQECNCYLLCNIAAARRKKKKRGTTNLASTTASKFSCGKEQNEGISPFLNAFFSLLCNEKSFGA